MSLFGININTQQATSFSKSILFAKEELDARGDPETKRDSFNFQKRQANSFNQVERGYEISMTLIISRNDKHKK